MPPLHAGGCGGCRCRLSIIPLLSRDLRHGFVASHASCHSRPPMCVSCRACLQVLRFLFTEINYGGRVTDDKDRRLINTLVESFCGPQLLESGCKFSASGAYVVPDCETVLSVRGKKGDRRPEGWGRRTYGSRPSPRIRTPHKRPLPAARQSKGADLRPGWVWGMYQ